MMIGGQSSVLARSQFELMLLPNTPCEQVATLPCRRGHGCKLPAARDDAAGTRWIQGAAAVDRI
jgi:hypothetical protein